MTYPDRSVVELVNSRFEAVRLEVTGKDPAVREVARRYRLLWSPGFVVLDPRGEELRRFLGYQPPRDFVAELRLALGKVHLLHRRYAEAYEDFRAVADLDPPAPVTPEALYWAGIAAYRRDGRPLDFLREYWEELRVRFPGSRWWTHADVFGPEGPGRVP
ncbi:MAG TPA: hypothetical protein VNK43_00735 [Gemmatimonadales bacterium]|nr:hypothetical protein [Gemmatimonadales bacterium]